jgi:uncharacterized coiled-coil DUF342 family protein
MSDDREEINNLQEQLSDAQAQLAAVSKERDELRELVESFAHQYWRPCPHKTAVKLLSRQPEGK